jgi:outer membrane protein
MRRRNAAPGARTGRREAGAMILNRAHLAVIAALAIPALAAAQERPVLDLSLDETVERALKNNVDIAVQRFNPELAAESVRSARGAYDPVLTSTLSTTSTKQRSSNVFSGANQLDTTGRVFNFGLTQALPTGGGLNLSFDNSRSTSNSLYQTYDPQYNSSFDLRLTQPLLRNFKLDSRRYQLRVARKNREISDVQFHQTVVNTVANVKQLYYDLLYAIDNLDAQRKSLALAQKFLEENRIKVRVGTMAPLDVVQAESEVASREAVVIGAEAQVTQAEDTLKSAIFPKQDAEMWALRIVPTDRPTAEPKQIDVEAAIKTALEKRTDVAAAHKNLEIAEAGVTLYRSQLLPQLDLIASYGSSGTGGRRRLIDSTDITNPKIVGYVPGGYGDAFSQTVGRDNPTWTLGVNVTVPILNRSAAAAAARSRLSHAQLVAELRSLELQVAAEVRAAARNVETGFKQVASTRAARVLAAQSLDAEEKKFAAGMSTNYLVTQKQRDLAVAEVNELQAIAGYRKSLITFDRAQESGGGSVSFASGG